MSVAWDGAALQRRLHPEGALALTLGPEADLRRRAFEAVAAGLDGAEAATALAAQEAQHLAQAWGRHAQVLVLAGRIRLRYVDAEAVAAGLEPQSAWLARP